MRWNVRVRILDVTTLADDTVGGAHVTGTATAEVFGFLTQSVPSTLLLQQGIEVETVYLLRVPGTTQVREFDEVEVVHPPQHALYGKRLKVTAVEYTHLHPASRQGTKLLRLRRRDFSRAEF